MAADSHDNPGPIGRSREVPQRRHRPAPEPPAANGQSAPKRQPWARQYRRSTTITRSRRLSPEKVSLRASTQTPPHGRIVRRSDVARLLEQAKQAQQQQQQQQQRPLSSSAPVQPSPLHQQQDNYDSEFSITPASIVAGSRSREQGQSSPLHHRSRPPNARVPTPAKEKVVASPIPEEDDLYSSPRRGIENNNDEPLNFPPPSPPARSPPKLATRPPGGKRHSSLDLGPIPSIRPAEELPKVRIPESLRQSELAPPKPAKAPEPSLPKVSVTNERSNYNFNFPPAETVHHSNGSSKPTQRDTVSPEKHEPSDNLASNGLASSTIPPIHKPIRRPVTIETIPDYSQNRPSNRLGYAEQPKKSEAMVAAAKVQKKSFFESLDIDNHKSSPVSEMTFSNHRYTSTKPPAGQDRDHSPGITHLPSSDDLSPIKQRIDDVLHRAKSSLYTKTDELKTNNLNSSNYPVSIERVKLPRDSRPSRFDFDRLTSRPRPESREATSVKRDLYSRRNPPYVTPSKMALPSQDRTHDRTHERTYPTALRPTPVKSRLRDYDDYTLTKPSNSESRGKEAPSKLAPLIEMSSKSGRRSRLAEPTRSPVTRFNESRFTDVDDQFVRPKPKAYEFKDDFGGERSIGRKRAGTDIHSGTKTQQRKDYPSINGEVRENSSEVTRVTVGFDNIDQVMEGSSRTANVREITPKEDTLKRQDASKLNNVPKETPSRNSKGREYLVQKLFEDKGLSPMPPVSQTSGDNSNSKTRDVDITRDRHPAVDTSNKRRRSPSVEHPRKRRKVPIDMSIVQAIVDQQPQRGLFGWCLEKVGFYEPLPRYTAKQIEFFLRFGQYGHRSEIRQNPLVRETYGVTPEMIDEIARHFERRGLPAFTSPQ
ncbi:hypothetical protein DIURU_000424 [Diutina rugosa]|uniref:Uncharacterized protein n=1 Tax=Diutina rugosa TaxID=5481 RepID=A0A642UZV0_DIURU|nr:uncharacterized protein DIURU_000424 [Diutina rugosa]KAA8907737.1 hypothetical protein DIURU_000424 [Diutina rugosa]